MEFEYLETDEAGRPPCHPAQHVLAGQQGFTSYGHRLSSLYRTKHTHALTLTTREPAPSSLQKYSTGVRGCETPAPSPITGNAL